MIREKRAEANHIRAMGDGVRYERSGFIVRVRHEDGRNWIFRLRDDDSLERIFASDLISR